MRLKLAALSAVILTGGMLTVPEASAQTPIYPNCQDGQFSFYRYYRSDYFNVNQGSAVTITGRCPTGGCIISGGYQSFNPNTTGYNVHYSYPTSNQSWIIRVYNEGTNNRVRLYYVCAF
jgi:hypothetical protein